MDTLEDVPAMDPIRWGKYQHGLPSGDCVKPWRLFWDRGHFWIRQTSEMYCRVMFSPPLEQGKGNCRVIVLRSPTDIFLFSVSCFRKYSVKWGGKRE